MRYLNEKDLARTLEDGFSLAHSLASSGTGLPRMYACRTERVLDAASKDGSIRVGDILSGTFDDLVGDRFFRHSSSLPESPLPRVFPLSRLAPPASRRCMDCRRADARDAHDRAKFDREDRCSDCLVPFDFEEKIRDRLLPRWRTGTSRFSKYNPWSIWFDSDWRYYSYAESAEKAKLIVGTVEDDGSGLPEAILELTSAPHLCEDLLLEFARVFDVPSGWREYGRDNIIKCIFEKQSIPGRSKSLSDLAIAALIVSEARDGRMTRAVKKFFDNEKAYDAKANEKIERYLRELLEFAFLCGRVEESSGLKPYAEKARHLIEGVLSHMFGAPFVLGDGSKKNGKRPVNDTVLRLFSSLDCPPSTTLALAAESGAGPEYSFFVQAGEPVTGVYFHEPDGNGEMPDVLTANGTCRAPGESCSETALRASGFSEDEIEEAIRTVCHEGILSVSEEGGTGEHQVSENRNDDDDFEFPVL